MLHHNGEMDNYSPGEGNSGFESGQMSNLTQAAYIVGGSMLISALIISGTVFYNAKNVIDHLGGLTVATGSSPSTGTPSAPGQVPGTPATAPAPGTPVKI